MEEKCFSFSIIDSNKPHAQNFTFKGVIIDKNKQPISYASVALLASDSTTLVTGTISDDKGQFQLSNINKGKYYVSLSFIGFKPSKELITLTSNTERTFVLEDDAIALNEVVVKTNRSNIIKQSATGQTFMDGRLILNLRGTDLTGSYRDKYRMDVYPVTSFINKDLDTRSVQLSVRYKFNASRSKYKGSSASEEERQRM